jgi:glycosyltransferase involved in cell wall biosynthesis
VIRTVGVIVPAHDEEELLPSCLASPRRAARALRGTHQVRLVVVADACRDRTARQGSHHLPRLRRVPGRRGCLSSASSYRLN